ncbi:MAG: APC family permease [Bacteroidetes bacterium]|nr:APC family permease [Bacteroidota bacterium]
MEKEKKLGLAEVISIAVGTMIGASLFSIFGVGAKIAGKNLPIAFVISGIYALIVAYSYAKMGGKIISNAGPIAFILEGIGDNIITGALSVLIWISYIVSISMFATGFAGYFLPLLNIPLTDFSKAATETLLVAFFTALNFFGNKVVGKAELFLVIIKVSILLLFIVGGLITIQTDKFIPSFEWKQIDGIIYASVIFFLSYMGFGLIINTTESMKNPEKNVPRAIFISIGIVMLIYVGVSVTAIGNLPISKIIEMKENALAMAAKPFLGSFGFILLSIAALFSLSSSLNATIYGGANIAYSLAEHGKLPKTFERKLWFDSTIGLYITAGLSILFVLLFNVEEIAAITSSIFTIIYIFVLISHLKLTRDYGGNKIVIAINLIILFLLFFALQYYQFKNRTLSFYGTIGAIAGALVFEYFFRKVKVRKFKKRKVIEEKHKDKKPSSK